MPALSPTMTEGNISAWKVKEGQSFVAGDVLLEIETDKASMDVEAQDDGIVAKIFQGDGSKGIKVGSRIGVLAEAGDDLSTLEIPAEEKAAQPEPKEEKQQKQPEPGKAAEKPSEDAPKKADSTPPQKSTKASGKTMNKAYPMLPSVAQLVHQKKISSSDVEKIPATGPKGQLLKGDVLAYLGEVSKDYPQEVADRFDKLSHLDLSNVKIAAAKETPKTAETDAKAEKPAPAPAPIEKNVQVALPISMAAAFEVQKRLLSKVGVDLPIATIISRAVALANSDLPKSKTAKPTADELFNEVLGLNNVHFKRSVGHFNPQVQALPATAMATVPRSRKIEQKVDVIDFLTGKVRPTAPKRAAPTPVQGPPGTTGIFSVTVLKGDEYRAKVFLENLKMVLEEDAAGLVMV